ncbi:MFS transporter [Kitasatospora sp. NPDC048722]|uniref:MFS transporter n=1 Tax=Kitasatospora sp. NPDC048722 TaxID=3155639 RepID=UPI0033D850F1
MPGSRAPAAATAAERSGFALLGAVQVALIFTLTLLTVPLPLVARQFGLGPSGVLLLSAAYGLSFSSLLLLGGRLADRYGGRRALRAGLALFGAASAACAVAPGSAALLAGRFGQGAGAALVAPAAVAVVRALHPGAADYRRAMATWGGLSVLGATAGSLVSGVVTAWASWRWPFAVPVLVAVLALVRSGALPSAEPGRGPRPGLDLRGALLATSGVCAASYGLVASTDHGWGTPVVLAPLAAGLVLLLAFAAAERRAADPLVPPGFLADRRRTTALAAVTVTATGTALTFLLLALYLQQVRNWDVLATSAAFLPYAAVLVLAGRLAAPLTARHGAVTVTAGGLAVAATGLALLAGLAPDSGYAVGLLPGLLLLPAGAGPAFAGAAVLATGGVPPERTGLAAGLFNTAMELGPTAGVAALMALAATRPTVVGGYAAAFAAGAAALALTGAAVATLPRATRTTRTTRTSEHTIRSKEFTS